VAGWNYARTWETLAVEVPDREAIVADGRRLTYRELDARATRLAHVLAAHGVAAGDVVAISLANRPEYLEAFFAALKLSAAPANLNYQYVTSELAYIVRDSDAAAIVFHAEAVDAMTAAVDEVGGRSRLLLTVGGVRRAGNLNQASASDGGGRVLAYEAALASAPPGPVPRTRMPDGDDRLFLYTGGTTGRPKGVVWRADDYYRQGWEAARPGTEPPDPATAMRAGKRAATLLPASPLVHATALGMATATLNGGGTVVLREDRRLDADALWRLVEREHVAVMSIVGETFARPLLDALAGDPHRFDLGSLRAIVSSGMAFTATSKQRLLDLLPGITIVDALGASEALITRSTVSRDRTDTPSSFAAAPNVKVITDDGREVVAGSDDDGVLAVAGRLPLGYHNDPAATARMFREFEGVRYATPGDRARVLTDGRIVLLGRGSACINTGGEKVYPEEVEAVLRAHPAVTDAAVVGVPDDRWGEMVVALVELADPEVDGELTEHCRTRLAGYKRPKRILPVDVIDRTVAGKPDYRALRTVAAVRVAGQPDGA
jgi:3-oxocholest-4-en-26-oate---CoA ligase